MAAVEEIDAAIAVQERIRQRGQHVRQSGTYIGLWELAVWSHLRGRKVMLAMGEGWIDLSCDGGGCRFNSRQRGSDQTQSVD